MENKQNRELLNSCISIFQMANREIGNFPISLEEIERIVCDFFNDKIEALKMLNIILPCTHQGKIEPSFLTRLVNEISATLTITFEEGLLISSGYRGPWTKERWKTGSTYYWDSFEHYLKTVRRWPQPIVSKLGGKADEILDHCGDPKEMSMPWQIRGLVVGEVQSGKTGTYTALINKAADAGYKIFIVLAGTTEVLRRQTLSRLEREFIGLWSGQDKNFPINSMVEHRLEGPTNSKRNPVSLTTQSQDFSKSSEIVQNFKLQSLKEPVILVVKKNYRILSNLTRWLKKSKGESGLIQESLMLIDDESDNASINTNDEDKSPTKINDCIRGMLGLFKYSTYIGFTATPYANILIDPEEAKDLFPKDFICCTDIPSNYFGLYKMFGQEGDFDEKLDIDSPYIRRIWDEEECLPLKHKKDDIAKITLSLKKAIYQFLIINVLRDLQGEGNTHRSMMINVTRFTDIQNRLRDKVEEFLQVVINNIKISSSTNNKYLRSIHDEFIAEFPDAGFTWDEINAQLLESVKNIEVVAVNSSVKDGLDYEDNSESGSRVVVVGGFSLSRGLTLEGLCVSYLYRNVRTADALTQMGRWFGYRAGYEELCRVWLTDDLIERYSSAAVSQSELVREFQKMNRESMTPEQWGLKIRTSPGAFAITSRNKMRHSSVRTVFISQNLSGELVEGYSVRKLDSKGNEEEVLDLWKEVRSLKNDDQLKIGSSRLFTNVPKHLVSNFVRNFYVDPEVFRLNSANDVNSPMADFIENNQIEKLNIWDVVFIGNSQNAENNISFRPEQEIEIPCLSRSIKSMKEFEKGYIHLKQARLTVPKDESLPLSEVEKQQLSGNEKSRKAIREIRQKPLLIIAPVIPRIREDELNSSKELRSDNKEEKQYKYLSKDPIFFYALSFCNYDCEGDKKENYAEYVVNKIWLEQHALNDDVELEEDDV